jgi:lysophospholipase L1-like esterase
MPSASTSNYAIRETRSNAALLSLGADGNLSLYTANSAHIVVDVSGAFDTAASAAAGRYVPTPPARALDTRAGHGRALPAGGAVTVPLPAGVPADATALAVTVTITGSPSSGYVSVYPADTTAPNVSALNTDAGRQTRTTTQIVPVSPTGLTVYSSAGGQITLDVSGYFTGPSATKGTGGLFVPAAPVRVLDTRVTDRRSPRATWTTATAGVTGPDVGAVAANITVAESGHAGRITAWAAGIRQPGSSAVSYDADDQTVSNLGITSVSTAGIAVAATTGAHAIVDITGWFTGTPLAKTAAAPRPNPTGTSGPIGCLQSVPAPSADGVYQIQIAPYQTVVHIGTAGPKGPIAVIGDSLTVGAAPQTARALRTAGWGPICIDATTSRTVEFGSETVPNGLSAARRIKASNPIWNKPAITWVVALGTNDALVAAGNTARSVKYVADQRAAIGSNPIWWMNLRTGRADWARQEAVFNQSIARGGNSVIDWYAASGGKAWFASDQIHLTAAGYQARADLLANTVRPR